MDSTRDRLIAATNELFRRRGYHGTSLKEVTRAAEATVGSLYHFFPEGKRGLTEAVIRETGAAYEQLFIELTNDVADPAAAVELFFDGAAETLTETDFIDLCPIGTVAREVASTDDQLRRAAGDVFDSWVAVLTGRLVLAGLDHDESEALARTVVCGLEGSFVVGRAGRDAETVRQVGRHLAQLIRFSVARTTTS